MISRIAAQPGRAYLRPMASAFFRMLALVALLLMPLGMAGAPALAQPAAASVGHCEEHQEPVEAPARKQAHCAACAALADFQAPAPAASLRPKAPRLLARSEGVAGTGPEIATPPPKLS